MAASLINQLIDRLHAQACYQLIVTPLRLPLPRKYQDFAKKALNDFAERRLSSTHFSSPQNYVLHRFAPNDLGNGKSLLITHGWMSRSAYMMRYIRALTKAGYEVFALDFPAHGESKGLQLHWIDAVKILRDVLNQFGPFHGVIGHSFGGSMLLNTLNLSGQDPSFLLTHRPEKFILIASPVRMRTPIKLAAKRLGLSKNGFLYLRGMFRKNTEIDAKKIRLKQFLSQNSAVSFLCIHGELDNTIPVSESILFCDQYPNAQLELLSGADHISVLMDDRVSQIMCDFL